MLMELLCNTGSNEYGSEIVNHLSYIILNQMQLERSLISKKISSFAFVVRYIVVGKKLFFWQMRL